MLDRSPDRASAPTEGLLGVLIRHARDTGTPLRGRTFPFAPPAFNLSI
jgi:hypothetical protein